MPIKNFNSTKELPDIPARKGKFYGKDVLHQLWALLVGAGDKVFGADISGIWLGAKKFEDAPFSVDMDGNVIATLVTLSGYVPYTGAAGNLDLGSYELFAAAITSISGGFDAYSGGAFNFYSDEGITLLGQFCSEGSGIYAFSYAGLQGELDFSSLTASDKTFTFPDKSGTIALTSDLEDSPVIVDNVTLTAQHASIGSTNVTNANVAGLYRVNYYLECTTLNAGATSVLVTFGWTDDAGATTVVSTTLPLTAKGRTSGIFFVQLASGNLTYSTTWVDATDLARYALYCSVERLN